MENNLGELTEDQKQFILENWNKMSVLDLAREIFKNQKLNARSNESKLVRQFLGSRKLKKKNEPSSIELLDSQKEYIESNVGSLTPLEIARIIFENEKLEPLSEEMAVVDKYCKTLNPAKEQFPREDYANGDYRPPDQISAIVSKVNKLLGKEINHKTMPTIQRKNMEAIKNFLNAPRFLQTINSYILIKTRELFEGEFIRTIADKPDLTPDELNIAITLCQHYVMGITIQKHLDLLNVRYEETLNDPRSTGLQSLAEMVKAKSDELAKCNKAQTDLTKFLSGERSKRQEKQGVNNISVARLVEWFRDEEERKRALHRADLQAVEDEGEIKRLEELSETKARILGISKGELLYG